MEDMNEVLSSCLYFSSTKLARAISKVADEEFRITGLSPNYAFLITIVNKNNGITQKKIGEMLHMTPSTITRFIDKLQYKDLLIRKNEGKNTFIYLTQKGMLLLPDVSKAWKNLYNRYSEILSEEEREQFICTINKVANKLEEKS